VRRKPYAVILLDEIEGPSDVSTCCCGARRWTHDGRAGTYRRFQEHRYRDTSNLGSQMIQQMAGDDYSAVRTCCRG
jgi:ATP-dependent Clp protease ATP-binding subunit ClpB